MKGSSALKRGVKRMVVRVGFPVHWEVCGQRLFRGVPLIHHGKLKLLGADLAVIRVDWDEVNRLVFRHVEVDRCRSGRAKSSSSEMTTTLTAVVTHLDAEAVDELLAYFRHPQLREFAAQHGWSYLSSENGHVSLAQDLAIRSLTDARMLFKLDEDIFIAEGFFEDLLRVMAVIHNVFAGHFSFGALHQTMRSAFGDRLAQF